MTISIIALIIVIILALLSTVIFVILLYTKVPFVRTPRRVINQVLEKINIKSDETVYDLGCGDARFLIEVEKRTGAKTFGYEISPWAYLLARLNILIHKSSTKVWYKNFYKEDLSKANVVFCFLIDTVMPKVGKQLAQQLQPGSRVISFAFAIKDWQPNQVIATRPNDPKSSKIYIYQR